MKNLIFILVMLLTLKANAQSVKQDFEQWLDKNNLTSITIQQKFVDSVNKVNKNKPNYSPHRHIWDYYANHIVLDNIKAKELLKLYAKEVVENRKQIDSLKKVIYNTNGEVLELQDKNFNLKQELKKKEKQLKELQSKLENNINNLEKGDIVIKHKTMFINITRGNVVTRTAFMMYETKMYRVSSGIYVFGIGDGESAKSIKNKVALFKENLKKVDWDRVENFVSN